MKRHLVISPWKQDEKKILMQRRMFHFEHRFLLFTVLYGGSMAAGHVNVETDLQILLSWQEHPIWVL